MHTHLSIARLGIVASIIMLASLPATARSQKTTTTITTIKPVDLAEQTLTAFGGGGGNSFSRRCPDGTVLTGLRGLRGLWMDAVGIICSPVMSNGQLGAPSAQGTLAGGTGGTMAERKCAGDQVVSGIYVRFDNLVSNINVECKAWDPATRQMGLTPVSLNGFTSSVSTQGQGVRCSNRTQPASGIHGRAASYLDAIGLRCDEP
jgi:hypothetical protein